MITICKANTFKTASNFVFEQLKRVNQQNLDVKHIVLVPDRASMEAERQLLATVGGSFNTEVLTIRRLANRILGTHKYLSKQAGIVALTAIVADLKKDFVCYKKGTHTAGFIENMLETISQLKYCKIAPKDLLKGDFDRSIAGKLHDIGLIFEAYQNFLGGNYIDSADKIQLLNSEIDSGVFENCFFYIYDFDNLSVQELSVLESLMAHTKGVTVACPVSFESSQKYLYLNDIYTSVLAIATKNNFPVQIVEAEEHSTKQTKHIGQHLFSFKEQKKLENEGFIEIFEGTNRVAEVYALACKVQQYIRSGGRYKDIFVVTSDLDKYANAINTVFSEFEIAYFCDRQMVLANHIYVQYIMDFLNMKIYNFQQKHTFNFVKNHFFQQGCSEEKNAVYCFENYCLKYNVQYNFKEPFTLGQEDSTFCSAEFVRAKLCELASTVEINLHDSVRSYVDSVKQLIEVANLNNLNDEFCLLQQDQYLQKITSQVADKFYSALTSVEEILGDRPTTLLDFYDTLNAVLLSTNISAVPVYSDSVVFANMAKARKHDIKFLALLGANQGQMPIQKTDSKLLSDKNIADMQAMGLNLEPQIYTENKRERFSLYQLLQEPTTKLYISYTTTDNKDSLLPSLFVTEICTLFGSGNKNLTPNPADEDIYTKQQAISKLILNRRRLIDKHPVKMHDYTVLYNHLKTEIDEFYFNQQPEITTKYGKELFLNDSQISVSKVTAFLECPHRFFFHYGLKARPRQIASLDSRDLGNILHAVLEEYVSKIDLFESDEKTKKIAESCFETVMKADFYRGLLADTTMSYTLNQLKAESVRMCCVVKNQLKNSKFNSFAVEFEFGKMANNGVDVLFDEEKFVLQGKIDRVDVLDNNFIVIDYKSGTLSAEYKEKDLYIGQKLQLLVYLKAIENSFPQLSPVGFYYFALHNNFTKEKVEPYSHSGRTINDVEIAQAIDTNLQNGKSARLGLKLKLDGDIYSTPKVLTKNQLHAEIDYTMALIQSVGRQMKKGYISVNPYKDVCNFCDHKSICDFNDIFLHMPRDVKEKITAETIETIVENLK